VAEFLLVLIEVNDPEGLPNPVVTKDERITSVSLDWNDMSEDFRAEAIAVLSEYEGEHPRINLALDRLRGDVAGEKPR